MNMTDTNKCFRGVLLWREDVLKCAKIVKKPLSGYIRDLFHKEMSRHNLTADDNKMLREQRAMAMEDRKRKHPPKRVLTVDRVTIPAKVRKNPVFVKGR